MQEKRNHPPPLQNSEEKSRGKLTNGTSHKTENKKDRLETTKINNEKTDPIKEEDVFEKTANELEEVLKKKFSDLKPKPLTQKTLLNTTSSTTPTSLSTRQEKIKSEPGKIETINAVIHLPSENI